MRSGHEIEVDGVKYITTHYSGDKAMIILAKLAKIMARPISKLVDGGMEKEASQQLISEVLQALTENVEPEKLPALVKEILEGTLIFIDGDKTRPIMTATDFQGNIFPAFKLIKEVLQFQYGDFFAAIAGAVPGLMARKEPTGVRKIRAS